MYWIYILQSERDGRTYVGYTGDFSQRLRQHNSGQNLSTKHRRPFKLLLSEQFKSEAEAKAKELWWKSGAGRREMKKLFK